MLLCHLMLQSNESIADVRTNSFYDFCELSLLRFCCLLVYWKVASRLIFYAALYKEALWKKFFIHISLSFFLPCLPSTRCLMHQATDIDLFFFLPAFMQPIQWLSIYKYIYKYIYNKICEKAHITLVIKLLVWATLDSSFMPRLCLHILHKDFNIYACFLHISAACRFLALFIMCGMFFVIYIVSLAPCFWRSIHEGADPHIYS